MSLIKNKEGNFYPISIPEVDWHCDYLWSTHRGCPFDCIYCSSKRLNNRFKSLGDPTIPRRLKGEWYDILGCGVEGLIMRMFGDKSIFVNPFCDMFNLREDDIIEILEICGWSQEETGTQFIFQTKKPDEYLNTQYLSLIPYGSWLGTTIETTFKGVAYSNFSKAPEPQLRANAMYELRNGYEEKFRLFITVEPIMELSDRILDWMSSIKPDLVFIGANTSKMSLPEPTNDELIAFIYALYDTIGVEKVYLKSNIRRLIPAFYDGWKLAEDAKYEEVI